MSLYSKFEIKFHRMLQVVHKFNLLSLALRRMALNCCSMLLLIILMNQFEMLNGTEVEALRKIWN